MGHPFRKNVKALERSFSVGVDEVGRGCLAGPVTVAALALPSELRIRNYELGKLKDSKKLSAKQREKWFVYVKSQPKILYAKASVYPKVIDRINISQAANLAATRAVARLVASMKYKVLSIGVLLDGGLYLNKIPNTKYLILDTRTVVRADEKFNCVKLASIVAKVSRDRVMRRNHRKFPQYGFDAHVGYGTKTHITAIKKHGYCELHRRSFLKNFLVKSNV